VDPTDAGISDSDSLHMDQFRTEIMKMEMYNKGISPEIVGTFCLWRSVYVGFIVCVIN